MSARHPRPVRVVVGLLAALASYSSPMRAEVQQKPQIPEGQRFSSVLALKQQAPEIQPQLRDGVVAAPLEWPASLYARFTTPNGKAASCTASLVSSTVMATAAHCVPTNRIINFDFDGKEYRATCEQHPAYVAKLDASADFGLCLIAPELQAPAGFLYEKFELKPMTELVGVTVVLTGFGCTGDTVGGDADGKYRIGLNTIAQTSESLQQKFGVDLYTPRERNNLFTQRSGANLCPGDSGGPAFRLVNGARSGAYANRVIIGVNSRVFYQDQAATRYGSSLVSAVGTVAFKDWARKWAEKLAATHKVEICGLFGKPSACR